MRTCFTGARRRSPTSATPTPSSQTPPPLFLSAKAPTRCPRSVPRSDYDQRNVVQNGQTTTKDVIIDKSRWQNNSSDDSSPISTPLCYVASFNPSRPRSRVMKVRLPIDRYHKLMSSLDAQLCALNKHETHLKATVLHVTILSYNWGLRSLTNSSSAFTPMLSAAAHFCHLDQHQQQKHQQQ